MNQININAENAISQGRYANIVSVTTQERDVCIDFISLVANQNEAQGQLVARIFLNRFTARELSELIQVAHQNWEEKKYGIALQPIKKEGDLGTERSEQE